MKPQDVLKKAREKSGYTQEVIAKEIGVSSRMYQRYESGSFPKYKGEPIEKLDKLLGINLTSLLYDKNSRIDGQAHPDHAPDLPPDTKALYERWLADKEKTQQQFHATNQGLIELLKNKLEEIATNLMTGQHQLKEQLFVVGEGLGQQLEGIALGLAAKEKKDAKKDINVSAQKRNTDGKSKGH